MDMQKIFGMTAKSLFDGAPVFEGMATGDSTTKQVLENVKATMAEAKDTCEGVIGMEGEYASFKNAEESASYLLCLMSEGVFPKEDTPYSSEWGRTFDSITGSCLNIAFGYALLKSMQGEIVLSSTSEEEAEKATEAESARKATEAEAARKAAEAEAARKAAEAEASRKAAEAKASRKAAEAEAAKKAAEEEAARKAAEEEAAAEKAEEESAAEETAEKPKKRGFKGIFEKAKSFLTDEDEDDESKPKKPKKPRSHSKKNSEILEDFVDE